MARAIELSREASKALKKMDKSDRERIEGALEEIRTECHPAPSKGHLERKQKCYVVRVGIHLRILLTVDSEKEDKPLFVRKVGQRENFYRGGRGRL